MTTITLKRFNYDTKETDVVGTVSTFDLVRSMGEKDFVKFIDEFVNVGGKDYRNGLEIGKSLQETHRTIQGCVIRFCMGIIIGLGWDVKYTDARNETPIALSQNLRKQVESGELKMGWLI